MVGELAKVDMDYATTALLVPTHLRAVQGLYQGRIWPLQRCRLWNGILRHSFVKTSWYVLGLWLLRQQYIMLQCMHMIIRMVTIIMDIVEVEDYSAIIIHTSINLSIITIDCRAGTPPQCLFHPPPSGWLSCSNETVCSSLRAERWQLRGGIRVRVDIYGSEATDIQRGEAAEITTRHPLPFPRNSKW